MKQLENICERPFPGVAVFPEDPRYATLARGFNQRFVGHPQYIQVCGDEEQVVDAVQYAVDRDLRITVRGGGHCYEDFVCDNKGGVIIDLSPLNNVCYDPIQNRYGIEGGCTLWNVYQQLYKEYGVTLPGGSCATVGAGGHIVGGGYGLLSRKYGLTIDYLYAVDVICVTKEKKVIKLTVSKDSCDRDERDLLWAHQGGGGGNFGIVTRYWFKNLPSAPDDAYIWSLAWNWNEMNKEHFTHLVTEYGKFFEGENSKPTSPYKDMFTLLHLTHRSAKQVTLTIQYVGDQSGLNSVFDFIHQISPHDLAAGPQLVPVGYAFYLMCETDRPRYMPWLEATQTLNGTGPNQRGKYKSAYMIKPFPPQQIETLWKYLSDETTYTNPQALVQIDSYGCQINAWCPEETAVPQRSSIMKLQYQTYWTDQEEDEKNLRWIRTFYNEMYGENGPYPDGAVDGCYVNYPDVDLKNWQYLYYKENYARLQRAKKRWDPWDIFHHAQSIQFPFG